MTTPLPIPVPLWRTATRWPWLAPDALPMRRFGPWLLLIVACGALVRLMPLLLAGGADPRLTWDGVPLPTSPDGYHFALGIKALLEGDHHALLRVPSAMDHALVALGALICEVLGCSPDAVMAYLPPVLGALVAVPIALIGRALSLSRAGLLAGLFAVLLPGFALRTGVGYFDTDPFAIGGPLWLAWAWITLLHGRRPRAALTVGLLTSVQTWLYGPGELVTVAMTLVGVALLWLDRCEVWAAPAAAVAGLAHLPLPWIPRTLLLIPLWWGLTRAPLSPRLRATLGFGVAVVGIGLAAAWHKLFPLLTFFGEAGTHGPGSLTPTGSVVSADQFIAEALAAPLSTAARNAAGSVPALLFAVAGWLLLTLRARILLVLGPVAALALVGLFGSQRFAIYATGPAALALAAITFGVAERMVPGWRRNLTWVVAATAFGAPSALFSARHLSMPALHRDEVAAMVTLGERLAPGDGVVAWWDDGYALQYYAGARTLADGGVRGRDAALVAEILLQRSQRAAANLTRLAFATQDRLLGTDWSVADTILLEAQEERGASLAQLMGQLDSPTWHATAHGGAAYLYLPTRLLKHLQLLDRVRLAGAPGRPPARLRLYQARPSSGTRLELGGGSRLEVDELTLFGPDGKEPLKAVHAVSGNGSQREVRSAARHPRAPLTGLYLKDLGLFAALDDLMVGALYTQVHLLGRTDESVLDPVLSSASVSILRVR